jgi:hypothetical protein
MFKWLFFLLVGLLLALQLVKAQSQGGNLIQNGDFSLPDTTSSPPPSWSVFGNPSDAIVWRLRDGVFEFYRVAGSSEAVVFQPTGTSIAANSGLLLGLDLGNTSSTRQRITVFLHDSNFADLSVCVFWLPPNTPLRSYAILTHTTQAWANVTLSIYASSSDSQGYIQLDNVALFNEPLVPIDRTICDDPDAPMPSSSIDSDNLLDNSSFTSPIENGDGNWGIFSAPDANSIQYRITDEVFAFYADARAASAAVLQSAPFPMPAHTPIEARFQLGNSSGIRQRVTILVHARDFSDLHVCVFWLAPSIDGMLDTYTIRTYSSQPWTAGTSISFYASMGASQGWIRLDNVTLRPRPSILVAGTECYEPGAAAMLEATPAVEGTPLIRVAPTLLPTATGNPQLTVTSAPSETEEPSGEGANGGE